MLQLTKGAQGEFAHLREAGLLQSGDFLPQLAHSLADAQLARRELGLYFAQNTVALDDIHLDKPPSAESLLEVSQRNARMIHGGVWQPLIAQ
ncbi:hypothetical protein D9M71_331480 [compost metagenome]